MKLLLNHIFVMFGMIMTCEGPNTTVNNRTNVQNANHLQDFDAILNHLRNIKMMVSKKYNLSMKSDSSLGKRKKCSITRDSLQGLKDIIDLSLSHVEVPWDGSNCEYCINSSMPSCPVTVWLIRCGIYKLINKSVEAENNLKSEEDITKWENEYNKLTVRYQEEENNLKLQIQQKQWEELNTLTNLKNVAMKLCLLELSKGKVKSAVDLFLKFLKGDSELREIIVTCYNDYGGFERVAEIAHFLYYLPSCEQKGNALIILFDIVKKYELLDNAEVLMLGVVSQQCSNVSDAHQKLKPHTTKLINDWAENIHQGKFEKISNAMSTQPIMYGNCLESIIKKSYDKDLKHGKKILHFIESLVFLWHKILGFKILYKEMKKFNQLDSYELVLLAKDIKSTMENVHYKEVNIHYKDQLRAIKNNLPSSVVKLIWNGDSCVIRARWSNENMYNRPFAYDEYRTSVLTFVPAITGSQSRWKFEFNHFKIAYTLQNTFTLQYLYATAYPELFDPKCHRRLVFTYIDKQIFSDSYWSLIPTSNGTYFKLRNERRKEYLYTVEGNSDGCDRTFLDPKKRYVFTKKSCNTKHCEWKIDC